MPADLLLWSSLAGRRTGQAASSLCLGVMMRGLFEGEEAFIFLLAAQEVSAAREMYRGAELSSLQAEVFRSEATTLGRAGEDFQRAEAVREDGSFSVRTKWATGKTSSFLWSDSTITFRYVAGNTSAHEPPKYVEIDGLDTKYRLMPDGAAVIKEIHGMDTVSIVGWQAYEGGKWGNTKYAKDEALYFQADPAVGETNSNWRGRSVGHVVYQGHGQLYFFNSKGVQKVIEADEMTAYPEPRTQRLELHMDGSEAKAFSQPDRELSVLIDAMLGEASCMGKSSKCAFRCFYDPDKDVCGPAPFCQKVEESTSPSILAPFGQQQKCKAAGAEEKEAADLAVKAAAEDLKLMALGVTEELEAAPEISKSGASRSTMKKTLKLYEKASALLNVWQALPGRLSPETGNFVQAKQRVALTDMKHWRGRADRLTVSEYRAAAAQPAASLKTSTQYSVAAKLTTTRTTSILVGEMIHEPTSTAETRSTSMAIVLVVPKKDGVWLAWSDDSNFRASEALPLGSEKGRDGLLEGIVPLWGNRSGETRSDQIRACSPFPAENFGNMTGRAVLAFMVDGSGSGKWMKGASHECI
ncbi:unnamed protein product [Effrenium voratum]|uniref:Uncharacterized protein n=1 Tax=Effrenium voratum TaxID=2562239 RepID=A0AA36ML36_9DINO|nr:unnamed protein product [Effrenium voratum]